MKQSLKFVAAVTTAVALTSTFGTAANAVAWSETNIIIGDTTNGSDWYVSYEGGIDHSNFYLNGVRFDQVICGTYGGLEVEGYDLDANGDFDLTEDVVSGDQVVTGTGDYPNGLDASVEYRVYAEGDLLRTAYTLTNNTGSAITFTPSTYEDPSDGSSDDATSTDGDNVADLTDLWYTTFGDIEGSPASAVYSKFWGSPNHVEVVALNGFSFNASDSSEEVEFADVTIAPGESFLWIFFHSYKTYDDSGNALEDIAAAIAAGDEAVAEFGDSIILTGRLSRDLDTTLPSNWSFTEPTEEKLPETGFDVGSVALAAIAALVAGAAVVTRRRKA